VAGFIEADVDPEFGYLGVLELKNEIFSNIFYTANSVRHVSIYYVLVGMVRSRTKSHGV